MRKFAKCLVSNSFLTPSHQIKHSYPKIHNPSHKINRPRPSETQAFGNISHYVMAPQKTHIAVLLRASCRFDSCWEYSRRYWGVQKGNSTDIWSCSIMSVLFSFYRTKVRGMTGSAGHTARRNIAKNETMQSEKSRKSWVYSKFFLDILLYSAKHAGLRDGFSLDGVEELKEFGMKNKYNIIQYMKFLQCVVIIIWFFSCYILYFW